MHAMAIFQGAPNDNPSRSCRRRPTRCPLRRQYWLRRPTAPIQRLPKVGEDSEARRRAPSRCRLFCGWRCEACCIKLKANRYEPVRICMRTTALRLLHPVGLSVSHSNSSVLAPDAVEERQYGLTTRLLWTMKAHLAWGTVVRLLRNVRSLTTRITCLVGTTGPTRPWANDNAGRLVSTMVPPNRSLWPPSRSHRTH